MSATQRDVAARAGVSAIVVSHVLHNRASSVRVSAATAERVREAAKELDYRVNVAARNFRSQQTGTIGVLHGMAYPKIRLDDNGGYLSSLMQGLLEGAFSHGYSLTLCPSLTGEDPVAAMSDGRFDGLVWYSTTQTATYYEVIETSSQPLVVIHATPEDVKHSRSTVICDNHQGIGLAVDHLFELGHRRFLFALGDRHNPETFARMRALEQHLKERGLCFSEEDVLDVSHGTQEAENYFSRPHPHTAAICYTDWTASRMIQAADKVGISLPKEFSVVGFDSSPFSEMFRPRITSIHQPLDQLGRIAIDLLVEQMKSKNASIRHEIVPCSLDIRESTCLAYVPSSS